jgi:hypothetical protein
MKTDKYGTKRWYNKNGQLHRDNDLPAVEWAYGDKTWYVNGKVHRGNDLPAIEYAHGTKVWYKYNKLHRLGGLPAKEWLGVNKQWWIYDKKYTYEQICNYYKIFKNFGRLCLKKIRMRRIKHLRWIHNELLCMPPKGSYPGGQDYHKMVSYFMSMDKN